MSSTDPTEPDFDPYLLVEGFTLELTDPESADINQAFEAAVVEPVRVHEDFVQLWLAAPTTYRPHAAEQDTPTVLFSPAEARELAAVLVARADAIDPPKGTDRV